MIKTAFSAVALAAALLPSMAAAQIYVGGSIGQSRTSFDNNDYSLATPGIAESQSRSKTAYKLYAGYELSKSVAIEAGYADLGEPKYNYSTAGLSGSATADQSALFVAAKGTVALNDRFGVFGKLGITRNKTEVTAATDNAAVNAALGWPVSDSKTKTRVLFGIGAEYSLNKNVSLRAEYENFGKFGDSNTTGVTKTQLFSLGVAYKF